MERSATDTRTYAIIGEEEETVTHSVPSVVAAPPSARG